MVNELSKQEATSLRTILAALDVIRAVDPEMPAQTLQALMEVVNDPGIVQNDLQKKLSLSTAATSRIVARLSEWKRHQEPGLNFVEARPNPLDRRFALVYPTARGMTFARKLIASLNK
jgi:DNA-binding MarR family transcriptional regulator